MATRVMHGVVGAVAAGFAILVFGVAVASARPLDVVVHDRFSQQPTDAQCELADGTNCYSATQIEWAYGLGPLYARGIDGRGTTVVLVDSFGSPTLQSDLQVFDHANHLPPPPSFKVIQPAGPVPPYDPDNADSVGWAEEASLDVQMAQTIAPGAHLLLVGDVDQLPSVGAGEVLRDLIGAQTLPVVRLTKIFRQAQQSGIVVNAHKVNAGRPPELSGYPDFFWFNSDETEATAALVADIVARRIPARFGLDPRRDVQVLCPMHRGPAGAGNLNLLLQEALTPYREGAPERRYGGRVFRVGDKVTQLRNNYDKGAAGVFNGTTGVVTGLSLEDHALTVRTDEDEEIPYDFDELDELAHAYAVTIHRSQGSQYPAVVIP